MGVAIEVGFNPVTLDADFLAAGGTELDYYFTFAVSSDGDVFVGYKNKLLRYPSNGQGGFLDPEVAYTQIEDGSDRWHQWRWDNIRIRFGGRVPCFHRWENMATQSGLPHSSTVMARSSISSTSPKTSRQGEAPVPSSLQGAR